MSMAPANRASIADGPALKLVHWILTFGPIAFSSQPSMLKNFGCSIANIQEHLIKRAVLGIAINQAAKLFGVAEGRQWAIDQADNLAKANFPRRSPQLVPAFSAAHALHNAGVLHLKHDELEKFFRKVFFIRNVANANRTLVVVTRQHH